MTISGLHHVQLAMPAGEEERAVEFNQDILGVPRVAKPPHLEARGGCWFESASVRIHLGVEAGFRPARKAHPALLVDDLAALGARLRAVDIGVTEDQPLPGCDRCYVSDPFGNRLELLEPR